MQIAFEGYGNAQSGLPSSIDRILPIWSCSLSSWRVRLDVFRIHERSSRPWAGIPCELASHARVPLRFAKGTVARRLICVPFHERDGWLGGSSASRFTKGTVARWLICVPV